MKEHDRIVLKAGDVGTIVHVYDQSKAYEIEFVSTLGCGLIADCRPTDKRVSDGRGGCPLRAGGQSDAPG